MSLNKFMHPRNIYRTPPDFKELAITYPEFRKFAKQELSGKVLIDFKDQGALRALTCTLLEKDFGLHVEIPLTRLVPTLPLRLNYVLWVEDLLQLVNTNRCSDAPIHGIDIGTGASCIYPLLAAKNNNWNMLATELDSESVSCANDNINRNLLQDFIEVIQVNPNTILQGTLDTKQKYDFCMCNPPFFSTEQDLDPTNKSRSASRPLPRNGKTGSIREVVIPGGEVAFILKLMQESKALSTTVRIYTTMVGLKTSLGPLKSQLDKLEVTSHSQTEFCQGHTTRWGLAWTFLEGVSLTEATAKHRNRKKQKSPLKYVVPPPSDELQHTVENTTGLIVKLLTELEIKYEIVKQNENVAALHVSALKNTWSHQRKKRRDKKRHDNLPYNCSTLQMQETQLSEGLENFQEKTITNSTSNTLQTHGKRNYDKANAECDKSMKRVKYCTEIECVTFSTKPCSSLVSQEKRPNQVFKPEDYVMKAALFVKKVISEIHIELLWLEGNLGKDAVHQVLQYIKNNLK